MMMWDIIKGGGKYDEKEAYLSFDGGDTNTQQGSAVHLHTDSASNGV